MVDLLTTARTAMAAGGWQRYLVQALLVPVLAAMTQRSGLTTRYTGCATGLAVQIAGVAVPLLLR